MMLDIGIRKTDRYALRTLPSSRKGTNMDWKDRTRFRESDWGDCPVDCFWKGERKRFDYHEGVGPLLISRSEDESGKIEDEDEDRPEFSLITGKYRSKKIYGSRKISPPRNWNNIELRWAAQELEERKPSAPESSTDLVRTNQDRSLSSRYVNPIGQCNLSSLPQFLINWYEW